MRPAHCKDVAYKRVAFPLTREEMIRRLTGVKVFTRTDYFILESFGAFAVAGISKKRGLDLFREVTGVEVLSLPETTAFVRDPECNVLNPHAMARKAVEHSQDTVVVLGAFEHISFVKGEKDPLVLRVVDFVPPYPSKTLRMVEDALRMGTVSTPVLVEPVLVDALAAVSSSTAEVIMFPCEAGRLEVKGRPVLYLDKTPPIDEKAAVALAGCPLSKKIFGIVYHRPPAEFFNVCPRDLALGHFRPGALHIARCCDVHHAKVAGGLALVPYGATMDDITGAIKALTGES